MDLAFSPPEPMRASGCCYSSSAMHPLSGDIYINTQIKLTFLYLFIDLFKDYRRYISFIRKFPEPVTIFNKAKYIKDRPHAIAFLTNFLETQAFSMFLEMHHQDPHSVFEQVIRSQLRGIPHSLLLHDNITTTTNGVTSSKMDLLSTLEIFSSIESYKNILKTYQTEMIQNRSNSSQSLNKNLEENQTNTKLSSLIPLLRNNYFPTSVTLQDVQKNFIPELDENDVKSLDVIETSIEGTTSIQDIIFDNASSFIEDCVERLLSEKPLSINRVEFLEDLFKLESSRFCFVHLLKKHSDLTRGTITELKPIFFDQLVKISEKFLNEANENNDFASPALFVTLMGSFKVEGSSTEEFMFGYLKDLTIWQNKYFWEAAFFESVARERKSLPDEYKVGLPCKSKWEDLTEAEQNAMQTKEANLLFGVLGSFAYHMLKTGISASEASSFLLQMCRLCDIDSQQTNDLQTLVSNMQLINESLEPSSLSKEIRNTTRRDDHNAFKLEYFASSKRTDSDSNSLYRRLLEQKGEKKHFDYSDEVYNDYTIRTLFGHKKSVSCMALCYPKLASGSVSGELRLWNLEKQQYSEFRFQSHTDRITSLIINEDILISASQDHVSKKKTKNQTYFTKCNRLFFFRELLFGIKKMVKFFKIFVLILVGLILLI